MHAAHVVGVKVNILYKVSDVITIIEEGGCCRNGIGLDEFHVSHVIVLIPTQKSSQA